MWSSDSWLRGLGARRRRVRLSPALREFSSAGIEDRQGRAATPQGKRPTLFVLIGSSQATSITVTSPEAVGGGAEAGHDHHGDSLQECDLEHGDAAEHTSGSLVEFARMAVEAGLPPGVLNVVVGRGSVIGPAMANHPEMRKISFTGGLRVGQELGRIAAERILPLTLELGASRPTSDAIRIANDFDYGLGAGIWTRDIGRVHRVAARLDAGRIVVNEYSGGFVQTPAAVSSRAAMAANRASTRSRTTPS